MIGQTLALKSPELFLSLSLCDTSSRIEPKPSRSGRIASTPAQSQGMEPLVEGTISRWFTAPFREQHKDVVDPVRTMIRRTPPQGYAGCCAAISALDLTDRLPAIKLPTLIVVGEEDQGTPVAASQAIQAKIAGSQLEILKLAAHLANMEQPEAFTEGADLVPGASQLTPVAALLVLGAGVDGSVAIECRCWQSRCRDALDVRPAERQRRGSARGRRWPRPSSAAASAGWWSSCCRCTSARSERGAAGPRSRRRDGRRPAAPRRQRRRRAISSRWCSPTPRTPGREIFRR